MWSLIIPSLNKFRSNHNSLNQIKLNWKINWKETRVSVGVGRVSDPWLSRHFLQLASRCASHHNTPYHCIPCHTIPCHTIRYHMTLHHCMPTYYHTVTRHHNTPQCIKYDTNVCHTNSYPAIPYNTIPMFYKLHSYVVSISKITLQTMQSKPEQRKSVFCTVAHNREASRVVQRPMCGA